VIAELRSGPRSKAALLERLAGESTASESVLDQLVRDGLVEGRGRLVQLAGERAQRGR
jgi:hypothetical protein